MSPAYITEYEGIATYINWTTALPWEKESEDILDLVKAKQVLDKNHFGIENIKSAILEFLATIILNKKRKNGHTMSHAPILFLVGLAGTGKTTLAVSIAEALGRQFARIWCRRPCLCCRLRHARAHRSHLRRYSLLQRGAACLSRRRGGHRPHPVSFGFARPAPAPLLHHARSPGRVL